VAEGTTGRGVDVRPRSGAVVDAGETWQITCDRAEERVAYAVSHRRFGMGTSCLLPWKASIPRLDQLPSATAEGEQYNYYQDSFHLILFLNELSTFMLWQFYARRVETIAASFL